MSLYLILAVISDPGNASSTIKEKMRMILEKCHWQKTNLQVK